MNRLKGVWEFLFPFIVVTIIWEVAVRTGLVAETMLPAPSTIFQRIAEMVEKGQLQSHLGSSFYRLTVGYLLSVVIGISLGALLALNKFLRDMFYPILSMLISVPTIAWVPVLLLSLGLGDRTVITAIFLGGFFAITFNTMRGVEMVDKSLANAARLMGVSGLELFMKVFLPASLVSVITGLRLGIGYAWRALVGGEMLSAMIQWGVGKMIFQARFFNDLTAMFVGLMMIGVFSFLVDRILLKTLEQRTVERWGMLAKR